MKRLLPISLMLVALAPSPASAVIRGHETPAAKYPWFVDMLGCGGTLVAPDLVLTAAHCVGPAQDVTVGEPFDGGAKRRILRSAVHPRFAHVGKDLSARFDVALLQLAEPVAGVTPVRIAEKAARPGERVHLLGRGKRRFFGLKEKSWPKKWLYAERELHTAVNVSISDAACERYYATNRYKLDYFAAEDMTCSLDPAKKPAKAEGGPWASVCMGDSGGPLLRATGGTFEQVGVVSWSEWCGLRHDPSVFMRPEMIRAFLAAPVWAPRALGPATVIQEGARLRCVAPAFEGTVERLTYTWSDGTKGETVDATKASRCAAMAGNAGGSSLPAWSS